MRETLNLKCQVMCSVENFRPGRKQLVGREHPQYLLWAGNLQWAVSDLDSALAGVVREMGRPVYSATLLKSLLVISLKLLAASQDLAKSSDKRHRATLLPYRLILMMMLSSVLSPGSIESQIRLTMFANLINHKVHHEGLGAIASLHSSWPTKTPGYPINLLL